MFGFGAFGEYAFNDAPSVSTAPVFEDSWHQGFSEPARYRVAPRVAIALVAWSAFTVDPGVLTQPEAVTADRFVRPFSEPVRFAPRLPTHAQQFAALVQATEFDTVVTEDRWHQPFSGPVRFSARLPAHAQQFAALVQAAPFPETVTEDRWHQGFSGPVRFSPRLPVYAQQFAALVQAAPFPEAVTEDRWHQPFSGPVRFSRRLPAHAQQFAALVQATEFDTVVREDRWHQPFSGPVRFSKRLATAGQQFSAWSTWPVQLEEGRLTLSGVAVVNAVATSAVVEMLRDPRARLVYMVEIHPGRNSDRTDT